MKTYDWVDVMKISQIKKSSRKIIKGSVKNSSRFLILLSAGIVLFSLLPFFIDFFLAGNPVLTVALLSAVFILGTGYFSSFKTGSDAWFLFYKRKKRGARAAYWLKPSKAAECSRLYISLFFRKAVWTAAFISPGAAVAAAAVVIAVNGGVEFNLFAAWLAGGTVLMITGMGFLYFFLQRYFLVPYIKASHPSMKNREVFIKSREYMSDSIKKAALLKISFLPWIAVSITVIPAFYAWSYYSQSCAVMASDILKRNHAIQKGTVNTATVSFNAKEDSDRG